MTARPTQKITSPENLQVLVSEEFEEFKVRATPEEIARFATELVEALNVAKREANLVPINNVTMAWRRTFEIKRDPGFGVASLNAGKIDPTTARSYSAKELTEALGL